jgi:hypothetical protein
MTRRAPDGWHAKGLPGLLDKLAPRFAGPAGTVVVAPEAVSLAGPVPAGQAGTWRAGEAQRGWQTFSRSGRTFYVAYLDRVDRGRFGLWGHGMAECVVSLRQWYEATGIDFRRSPGITGIDLLLSLPQTGDGPTWRPKDPGPDGQEMPYTSAMWKRAPVAEWVHSYDGIRSYLAAAGNVEVCPWPLKNTGRRDFDRSRAGWWLVELSPWTLCDQMPDPAGYGPDIVRTVGPRLRWITTPTGALLAELTEQGVYGGFRVVDSWTGPGRRVLSPWTNKLRDAFTYALALPDPNERERLTEVIKDAGNHAIGLLANDRMSVYRPDWAHSTRAVARCNGWRKCWHEGQATGRWPVRIETDAVHYESTHEEPGQAAPASTYATRSGTRLRFPLDPTGATLGAYRWERTWRVRQQVSAG